MKKRTKEIIEIFDKEFGTTIVHYLDYENAWQLLVATTLSAQCTDARVNIVTKELFKKYPSIDALASANLKDVEEIIRSTGFYHNKAKNIIGSMKEVRDRFHGVVPSGIEELTSLPGVGRKTANVVRGNIFHEPSVVVDTHVKRVSNRLKLTKNQDPVKIEMDLMKELPKDHWILFNIQAIAFGRKICHARGPKCDICSFQRYCKKYQEDMKGKI
ncbi:endonuclease III [Aequitasia blattaphilus]|uniref:Endonuclease III n=1 Tax=Aequitasia blattaphilus TaxID=2949332 RepID=A0ABT1E515_9FIRM|nr:endonuclease III [Aequitasia blattaphilus]MCP1100939.1 endonuclease III [Aequitasia blattaphilus]MCR8613579.1 endonuclease III [Aequitasia blattaphilus]